MWLVFLVAGLSLLAVGLFEATDFDSDTATRWRGSILMGLGFMSLMAGIYFAG